MKGLQNLGNTCYLNAALQVLLFTPPLANYVLSGLAEKDLFKKRLNACALAREYISLAKAYWGSKDPAAVDTRGVHAALSKIHRTFANSQPHDAHEAWALVVKHLHDAFTTKKVQSLASGQADKEAWDAHSVASGHSMLTEMFQGQMESTITAPGGITSVTHEHFTGLSLDLDAAPPGIAQALARTLDPVQIQGYKLPNGDVVDATQTKVVRYMPLILMLHLKRFHGTGEKNGKFVDYSTSLDLGTLGMYTLFGVIFHHDGHYTAACEVRDQWYLCDDTVVTKIPVNSVVQKDAYVLLYKRKCNN